MAARSGGLVVAALCAVFPGFAILAANDTGRGGRFAEQGMAVRGFRILVAGVVRNVRRTGRDRGARPFVRAHRAVMPSAQVERMPRSLVSANVQATQAFLAPLQSAAARRAELRQQQQDGLGDLRALGDAIDVADAEVPLFLERYAMSGDAVDGPRPLGCAFDSVQQLLSDVVAQPASEANALRANAILLVGAAFDGHAATQVTAAAATLPGSRAVLARCAGLDMRDALVAASAIMADARAAPSGLAKDEAMRELLRSARWQWAGGAALGLALLHLARRAVHPRSALASRSRRGRWPRASLACPGRSEGRRRRFGASPLPS